MRFSRPLALLLTLVAGTAAAQPADAPRRSENPLASPPPAEAPAPAGQLTRPPELLQFVEAAYPKDAEAAKLTGSVGLIVDIDASGAVTAVEVAEPAGHGFDEAAVAAVRQFEFRPAEIDGQPAPVRIAYHYNFVLRQAEPERAEQVSVVNLRGIVLQRGSREPLANATVSVDDGAFGATTDAQGRFEIADVPVGNHRVVANASGFDRFETDEEIVAGKVTEVTYYVRKLIYTPYETVVKGKRERKEVARVELKQEEIRLIPGTQGDAFKVVQNLPGVARAPYGFGLLIVRGGRPFDTRVYLDGVWIPNIFHFGGLTAVFNSDLLDDITFQPGNFGSQYGRSIGGAIEGTTRIPSRTDYHGYFNVSLLDTTGLVEGPVNEDWSFAAAGRVSYVDLVLQSFVPATVSFLSAPRYFDYQAKLDYAPKQGRDQLRFMAFGSNDSMKVLLSNPALVDPEGRSDIGGRIGFHRLSGAWTHGFSPTVRNKLTLALGEDVVTSSAGSDIRGEVDAYTIQLRDAFTVELGKNLSFDFGADAYVGRFWSDVIVPNMPLPGEVPDPVASRQLRHMRQIENIVQPALFAEAIIKPFEGTRIVPGLRLDYEGYLDYATLDPRLSVFQQLGEKTLLKGAVGLYQQPPDFRAGQWTAEFGNPELQPERSLQTMLGVERKLTDAISLDLQVYYQQRSNLMFRSSRTITRDGQEVLERYNNTGEGRAYGAEILLRHELTHNFFGWIAYSIARSERRGTLWADQSYRLNAFDQPHHLVVVASYKWPYDWVTGLRLQYASGNLLTPIIARVYDADGDMFMPVPGQSFTARGPGFLSLDLRVDKRFVFDKWMLSTYLDVQNVTNNTNAEYVIYNYDFTQSRELRGLPIFPTLGVKAEF